MRGFGSFGHFRRVFNTTTTQKKETRGSYRLKSGPVFQMLVLPTQPLGGSVMFSFSKSSWIDWATTATASLMWADSFFPLMSWSPIRPGESIRQQSASTEQQAETLKPCCKPKRGKKIFERPFRFLRHPKWKRSAGIGSVIRPLTAARFFPGMEGRTEERENTSASVCLWRRPGKVHVPVLLPLTFFFL